MADEIEGAEAAPDTTQDSPSIDLSPIEEQLARFDGRFTAIEQALSQRGEEPQDEADPLAQYYEDFGIQQEEEDPRDTLQAIARLSRDQAQDALNPQLQQIQAELQSLKVERDLAALKQEFPDLNKPEVAEAVAGIVEEHLVGLPPEARMNPNIVRLAVRAYQADQLATSGEGSASHPELERPGGAAPEGSELTWNDRIMQGKTASKSVFNWDAI